jgi:hypothetical protein
MRLVIGLIIEALFVTAGSFADGQKARLQAHATVALRRLDLAGGMAR